MKKLFLKFFLKTCKLTTFKIRILAKFKISPQKSQKSEALCPSKKALALPNKLKWHKIAKSGHTKQSKLSVSVYAQQNLATSNVYTDEQIFLRLFFNPVEIFLHNDPLRCKDKMLQLIIGELFQQFSKPRCRFDTAPI